MDLISIFHYEIIKRIRLRGRGSIVSYKTKDAFVFFT